MIKTLIFFFCCALPITAQAESTFTAGDSFKIARAVKLGRSSSSSSHMLSSQNSGTTELVKDCDPNCSNCNTQTGDCNACVSGRFLYDDLCLICPDNASCNGVSFSCRAGYYKNGQSCSLCSANTYSTGGATSCISCPSGTFSNAGASSCTPIPANCTSYTSSGKCTVCKSGYYLSNGTCYQEKSCGSNCNSCDKTTGICSSCPAGYYLSSGACSACPSGTYSLGSNISSCFSCSNLQVNIGSNVYVNCSNCTSTGTCTSYSCPAGYYTKNSGGCGKCPTGCSSCTEYYCTACESGYTLTTGSNNGTYNYGSCVKNVTCTAGYYLSNGSCIACSSGTYSTGSNQSSCKSCSTLFVGSNKTCTSCSKTGFCTGSNSTSSGSNTGSSGCPSGQSYRTVRACSGYSSYTGCVASDYGKSCSSSSQCSTGRCAPCYTSSGEWIPQGSTCR